MEWLIAIPGIDVIFIFQPRNHESWNLKVKVPWLEKAMLMKVLICDLNDSKFDIKAKSSAVYKFQRVDVLHTKTE